MKLSKALADIFEREFQKVFEKEQLEKDYLNQDDYDTCRDRAVAGINDALPEVIDFLAAAIATHRELDHSEDHTEEVATLSTSAVSGVGTMSWWT